LQGHDKFYSRSTNGKYELDVTELRIAFNLSGTSVERIRSFRQDRISRIFANETPVPFKEGAKIILHLIPITAFDPSQQLDVQEIASHQQELMPMMWSLGNYGYNLDGFLTYSAGNSTRTHSYVQTFRNGIIELIKSVPKYLSVLKALNVALPVFIFLTLVGVKGYSIPVDRTCRFKSTPIDREVLILPEVMIVTYECRIDEVLRPIFDSIWNACGYPKSPSYDKEGKWHP
jgi:hypothetical protein